jgi:hypothetical protein
LCVVRDVAAVWRQERRVAARAASGDHWYEWIGDGVGVVLIGLVLAGVLPAWTLAFAVVGPLPLAVPPGDGRARAALGA